MIDQKEEIINCLTALCKSNRISVGETITLEKAIKLLEQQPKTGHWVDIMVGDMPAQACDRCNTFFPLAYTGGGHHYCPNCGADMRGESE